MVSHDYSEDNGDIEDQIQHLAKRIREEREKLRMSQMDLSFKSGLSQNQVNYIETGKRTPNLHTLLSICRALQISPAVLFESVDAERREAKETIIRLVSQYM
jgi:transcriptional regulator with XRE-family HTH domain